MAVSIEPGDAVKIARNLGQAGRPLPDALKSNAAAVAAYDQAQADGNRGAQFHPPAPRPKAKPPKSLPAAPAGPKASAPAPAGAPSPSPTSSSGGVPATFKRAANGAGGFMAGDAGGLLLALVLYPLVLVTFQQGAAGPGLWFRAKWLNETAAQPNNLPAQADDPNSAKTDPGATNPLSRKPVPGTTNTPVPGTTQE